MMLPGGHVRQPITWATFSDLKSENGFSYACWCKAGRVVCVLSTPPDLGPHHTEMVIVGPHRQGKPLAHHGGNGVEEAQVLVPVAEHHLLCCSVILGGRVQLGRVLPRLVKPPVRHLEAELVQ